MIKLLMYFLFGVFYIIPILGYSQCENDICETSIELNLCYDEPLSVGCTTTYNQEPILFNNNLSSFPPFPVGSFILNDHWYHITLEDTLNITITIISNYNIENTTSNTLYGLNEGIRFVMYYGESCDNLTPVFYSQNPVTAGLNCNNINDPNFINTVSNAWLWENVGIPADGFCPFDPTVQNINITLTLIPGTYWFQVFPFSLNENSISSGEGTINICGLFFLNYEDITIQVPFEDDKENPYVIKKGFKKIIHPRFGLLIHDTYRDNFYDLRMRQVYIR